MRSCTPEDVDCVRETGVGTQAESVGTGMWFPPTASSSSKPSRTTPNSPQRRDQLTGNYEKPSTTPRSALRCSGLACGGRKNHRVSICTVGDAVHVSGW